jgi:hypothetical protein
MKVNIGRHPKSDIPRRVKITIDPYDTWNMDHTLALIIVPMLKQLKATKHGAPFVDDEYVPYELSSSAAPNKEHEWDVDDNHFKRWNYVLDEMIWAMEQIVDFDNDSQFYDHSEVNEESDLMAQVAQIKCDYEGLQKHHDRIANGTKLFGIFFQSLWD